MKNRIIGTIIILVLNGCSPSSPSSEVENIDTAKVSSEIIRFAKSLSSHKYSNVDNRNRNRETIECEYSGSMSKEYIDNSIDNYHEIISTEIYDNCKNIEGITNGSMQTTISGTQSSIEYMKTVYKSDFSYLSQDMNSLIYANSFISINFISQNILNIEENIKMLENNELSETQNLLINITLNENSEELYFLSGDIIDGDIVYSVDTQYNGSLTPLIMDFNGDIVSGKTSFIDSLNQKIMIEFISNSTMKIYIDTNNDDKFDIIEDIEL